MPVTGVNEIIQHAMSFAVFGTHVILETPPYDYSVTGQAGAPHDILSMGPECDATPLPRVLPLTTGHAHSSHGNIHEYCL